MQSARSRIARLLFIGFVVMGGVGVAVSLVGFVVLLMPNEALDDKWLGEKVTLVGMCLLTVAIVLGGIYSCFQTETETTGSEFALSGKIATYLSLGLVGTGVTFVAVAPAMRLGWILLNLSLFAAFEPLLVLAHELGHASCAWLLGVRVIRVSVGVGRTIAEVRWRGTRFQLRERWLSGGATFSMHLDAHRYRVRQFFIVLSGPLVNACLIAIYCSFVSPAMLLDFLFRSQLEPGLVFFWINVFSLVSALVPRDSHTKEEGLIHSDGWQLCTIPFQSRQEIEQTLVAMFLMAGNECLQRNETAEALEFFRRARLVRPHDAAVDIGVGVAFLNQKDFVNAREQWWTLLRRTGVEIQHTVLVWNNIAVADLLLLLDNARTPPNVLSEDTSELVRIGVPTTRQLLMEADEFSGFALTIIERMPEYKLHFRGTRGCVLVALGQYEEGSLMLRLLVEQHPLPQDKAFCACFLALAEATMGHEESGMKYLAQARDLDPECIALESVAKWISLSRATAKNKEGVDTR